MMASKTSALVDWRIHLGYNCWFLTFCEVINLNDSLI